MKKYIRNDILSFLKDNHSFRDGFLYITNSNSQIVYIPSDANISKQYITYKKDGFMIKDKYLSFSHYIPEYKWYITAIKDLSNIKKEINKKQKLFELRREENVKTNYYLLLFTWFISFILSIYLSYIINKKLKEYENQIQESNQQLIFQSRQALLGELLPMIAHQWRQPINKIASIIARIRFMPKEKQTDIILNKYYKDIEDQIEFMSETIDDFREFYQPKRFTTTQNLKELIIKSVDFVNEYIKKKDIKVDMKLDNISYDIHANEFLQIMINLIKNAVDALDIGGYIDIELFRRKNYVYICISDNGKGINDEDFKKIFEPYFSTKEKSSMGLGLYMSKVIVERHMHGKLHVKRLQQGTMFYIMLPI
jgi:signal transduction histidine kinase